MLRVSWTRYKERWGEAVVELCLLVFSVLSDAEKFKEEFEAVQAMVGNKEDQLTQDMEKLTMSEGDKVIEGRGEVTLRKGCSGYHIRFLASQPEEEKSEQEDQVGRDGAKKEEEGNEELEKSSVSQAPEPQDKDSSSADPE